MFPVQVVGRSNNYRVDVVPVEQIIYFLVNIEIQTKVCACTFSTQAIVVGHGDESDICPVSEHTSKPVSASANTDYAYINNIHFPLLSAYMREELLNS